MGGLLARVRGHVDLFQPLLWVCNKESKCGVCVELACKPTGFKLDGIPWGMANSHGKSLTVPFLHFKYDLS